MSNYFDVRFSELTICHFLTTTDLFDEIDFDNLSDLELLDLCLEKWNFIRQSQHVLKTGGFSTCALCQKYYNVRCFGCPIYKKGSYYRQCRHTPNSSIENGEFKNDEEYSQLVDDEIKFLEQIKKDLEND